MFGDAMFDEEDRVRRAEEGLDDEHDQPDNDADDVDLVGGLTERLRRRQAVAQLLREVGGC